MYSDIMLVQEEPRGPSQLVEIPVNTNGVQKVKCPDVQQLRSDANQRIIIKAMRLVTPKILARCMTIGAVNAPLAELQKISLVIYAEGWEKAQMIPILTLNDYADADATTATTIPFRNKSTRVDNWEKVDWAQSYLLYSIGSVVAVAPYGVMLEVEYVKLDGQGKPVIGPS